MLIAAILYIINLFLIIHIIKGVYNNKYYLFTLLALSISQFIATIIQFIIDPTVIIQLILAVISLPVCVFIFRKGTSNVR
jgi:hypothetical protein